MYVCAYVYVQSMNQNPLIHNELQDFQYIAYQHCTCMVHECRVLYHSGELILQVVLLLK